ncbi:Aspartic proteinase Asp1 [Platanthera guangdongensis]|uniref:Aspartic proteinase Asp1 n=1 Tax=Platanthera guangdongensis TaxID=2320717 RepID=A0ABR2M406_9ASPA
MAAIIAAVLLAGFPSCSTGITPSTPSTSPRKPRFWPWWEPSPLNSPSTAAPSSIPGEDRPSPSSIILPVYGNVYPHGFYYVLIYIGEPPRPYFLDVDSGSDVTWLQCDAPCVRCSQGPHPLYRPAKNRLVPCEDPLCAAFHESTNHEGGCDVPHQCDYEIEYQDHGSSVGVLVADAFALHLTNSSDVNPILTFGCGYDQQAGLSAEPNGRSATDGVIGIGSGKAGILSQLRDRGVCLSVVGHCLSRQRAGFLFFGEDVVPPRSVNWAPMARVTAQKYYSPGVASIYAGKQLLGANRPVVLDSGSSYTYFSDLIYQSLLSAVSFSLYEKVIKYLKILIMCSFLQFQALIHIIIYFKKN